MCLNSQTAAAAVDAAAGRTASNGAAEATLQQQNMVFSSRAGNLHASQLDPLKSGEIL